MKKIIILFSAFIIFSSNNVMAEDSWKELFVTRLMKLMSSNPTYTDIVLTDLDQNGKAEAFLLKKGTNGNIQSGITFKNNTITSITVPKNITGASLEDLTLYDVNGEHIFVGKEIARYTDEIKYF